MRVSFVAILFYVTLQDKNPPGELACARASGSRCHILAHNCFQDHHYSSGTVSLCCFLPRSPLLCAFAALMCGTWGFYRVLNIAPQGSHNPDSISNYATESSERERERCREVRQDGNGLSARWIHLSSTSHICNKQKKHPRAHGPTYTNTPTCANQGALCPPGFTWSIVSTSQTLQISIRGGRAASIFEAVGLKGIDRYTTFGHICSPVGSGGATAERLLSCQ